MIRILETCPVAKMNRNRNDTATDNYFHISCNRSDRPGMKLQQLEILNLRTSQLKSLGCI